MKLVLPLLLAQAIAGPVLPAPPRPRSDAPCPAAQSPDEVVVCALDQERYRLRPLRGGERVAGLPRAEVGLGGGTLGAVAEQGTLPNGQSSPRLMLRWRVPVGTKR